jgi:hypothetical protein
LPTPEALAPEREHWLFDNAVLDHVVPASLSNWKVLLAGR